MPGRIIAAAALALGLPSVTRDGAGRHHGTPKILSQSGQ
jgi:hypothetical protein